MMPGSKITAHCRFGGLSHIAQVLSVLEFDKGCATSRWRLEFPSASGNWHYFQPIFSVWQPTGWNTHESTVCESHMCQMTATWWAQLQRNVWSRSHAYKNTFKSQTGGAVWGVGPEDAHLAKRKQLTLSEVKERTARNSACQNHLRAAFIQRLPTPLTTPTLSLGLTNYKTVTLRFPWFNPNHGWQFQWRELVMSTKQLFKTVMT